MRRPMRSVRQPFFLNLKRCLPVTLIAACLGLLAAASPATAAPGRGGGCGVHAQGGQCLPSCAYSFRRPYAQKQFNRGYYQGQDDGWDQGYYDGMYGRRFCDQPAFRIRRHSRHFVDGVLDGFSDGYAAGFRKGERSCRYFRRPPRRSYYR